MKGRKINLISMWRLLSTATAKTVRSTIAISQRPMTFSEVVGGWRSHAAFRAWWSAELREFSFEAYCWETPPLTPAALGNPFECVFVESPALRQAQMDPKPFAEHFRKEGTLGSVTFPSLGGDAVLVVPRPIDVKTDYAHLASFVRTASDTQTEEIWLVLAEAFSQRIGETPIWMSTAGLGVSWLHLRLDSRPKYYRHAAYASDQYWRTIN